MSEELIESSLKDISAYLNYVQSKIKDFLMSQKTEDKAKILNEMKEYLQKVKENVSLKHNLIVFSNRKRISLFFWRIKRHF